MPMIMMIAILMPMIMRIMLVIIAMRMVTVMIKSINKNLIYSNDNDIQNVDDRVILIIVIVIFIITNINKCY